MLNTCLVHQNLTCEIFNQFISRYLDISFAKMFHFISDMRILLVKMYQFHIFFTYEIFVREQFNFTWKFGTLPETSKRGIQNLSGPR